jgi:hypothetical protein
VPAGLNTQDIEDNATHPSSSASSFGDMTSSITSRISTFLTFLGRNPPTSSEVSPTSASIPVDRALDLDNVTDGNDRRKKQSGANWSAGTLPRPRTGKQAAELRRAEEEMADNQTSGKSDAGRQLSRQRSPSYISFDKSEEDTAACTDCLYTATLGRSRSLRGVAAKRQPIRFVRESHQPLSTFSSAGNGTNGTTGNGNTAAPDVDLAGDNKYRALLDENRPTVSAYRKLLEQSVSSAPIASECMKYNTLGNRSFSVSKYIKQRINTADPRETSSNSGDGVMNGLHPKKTSRTETDDSTLTLLSACDRRITDKQEVITNNSTNDAAIKANSQRGPVAGHVTFGKFDTDIDRLVRMLNDAASATCPSTSGQWPTPDSQMRAPSVSRRDELLILTRRFVADSQRMVSSAVGSSCDEALANSVQDSLTTLSEIVDAAVRAAGGIYRGAQHHGLQQQQQPSPKAIIMLGRVRDMVETYRSTVWTARMAAGKPFDSVEMKALVTQATSLAAMLGSLIRMLSRVE